MKLAIRLYVYTAIFLFVKPETGAKCVSNGTCELKVQVLRCTGCFDEPKCLKNEIQKFKDTIDTLELINAQLDALPDDIFEDMVNAEVHKIVIDSTAVELLHVPELGLSPFTSICEDMEYFEVYDSSGIMAWNWSSLTGMEKLTNIIVENSPIIFVSNTLSSAPKLRFIQLRKTSIKWLHPKAFNKNVFLTICSLAENFITELQKDMFPTPANTLWSLDLSGNLLRSLPWNFFSEMYSLRELKLNNNYLAELTPLLMKPIWINLTMLRLQGNVIECPSLCWLKLMENRPFFFDSTMCRKTSHQVVFVESYFDEC